MGLHSCKTAFQGSEVVLQKKKKKKWCSHKQFYPLYDFLHFSLAQLLIKL